MLEEQGIQRINFPARLPDLNPIEHAWDALVRKVADHQDPPMTIQQLQQCLLEEWQQIPQESLGHLNRCEAVLAVADNQTPY